MIPQIPIVIHKFTLNPTVPPRSLKPKPKRKEASRHPAIAKRLIPSFNRILVEKLIAPSKTESGILLPEKAPKINSGKVVAVGPGARDRDGKTIPVHVKEGDTVLLLEYVGIEVKLEEKEYLLCRDEDVLGTLHD